MTISNTDGLDGPVSDAVPTSGTRVAAELSRIPAEPLIEPVHAMWTTDEDGARTACGLRRDRTGDQTIRIAFYDDKVTCPECLRTLKAAMIGQ